MDFIEYNFIFFPIVLILFYVIRIFSFALSKFFLLICSLSFLLYVDLVSFSILLFLTSVNFVFIYLMTKGYSQFILKSLGIFFSLWPLFFYKFFVLRIDESLNNEFTNILSFGIPLGLAFYSLQQITALFDAIKQPNEHNGFIDYLFFSFFFVYIPSGPITPYNKIITQIDEIFKNTIPLKKINMGISLFIFGFAKKTLLADPIAERIDGFYTILDSKSDITFSVFELIYIAWGSVLEFYFQFSAYSDMAIGIALCFGITLSINFNSPLKVKTPMEYISSWHISFMNFVREYVFQPTFMKVKKIPISKMELRYIIAWSVAVFLTFFVTGIWHSPAKISVFISLFVALFMVTIELSRRYISVSYLLKFNKISDFLSRSLLLFMITLTSIFFRAPENIDIFNLFFKDIYISLPSSLFEKYSFLINYGVKFNEIFPSSIFLDFTPLLNGLRAIVHILVATFIVFFLPNTMEIFNLVKTDKYSVIQLKWNDNFFMTLFLGIIFSISLLLLNNKSGFIYG